MTTTPTAPEPAAHAMNFSPVAQGIPSFVSGPSGTARTRGGIFVDLASLTLSLPHVWRRYTTSLAFFWFDEGQGRNSF